MLTKNTLAMLQALPLEVKIEKSKLRIREFFNGTEETPTISFSGGKDSTVLLHLVREERPETGAVFLDTGLEYPEIRKFVKGFSNLEVFRPTRNFHSVVRQYGYPIVSKDVSKVIYYARKGSDWALLNMEGLSSRKVYDVDGNLLPHTEYTRFVKYQPLVTAPFLVSDRCCYYLKKGPLKTHKSPKFMGTLAEESMLRTQGWVKTGCNNFGGKEPKSTPLAFWTEQDILTYLQLFQVPYCEVYGGIQCDDSGKLSCSKVDRTGCMFCGYGAHLDKGLSRFEKLKETHPKIYDYCINGGGFDPDDGLWKPNRKGLGMGYVFDWCNANLKNFEIRY